jgi:hypothetical protein
MRQAAYSVFAEQVGSTVSVHTHVAPDCVMIEDCEVSSFVERMEPAPTFTAIMYAIVKKVVRPALSSVMNFAPLICLSWFRQSKSGANWSYNLHDRTHRV